ncbi:MAG: hypothetical protein J6N92_04840 [Alloprevotella sp.]|nr:hypothetical protein [Alloprevotella sp.]
MRKITSLFALLLLTAVAAVAQPSVDGKLFTLNCARGYVYYNGSALKGTSDASQASQFAIVSYGETNYLYDATNGAFVVHTTAATAGTTGNNALESTTDFSKAVTGLKWGDTGIANYPYYLEDSYGNWLNMDGGPSVYFNTWKDFESGNGGNTYAVNVVGDFDATAAVAMLDNYFNPSATVQYVIKDGSGNVVYTTEAAPANVGDNISSLPASLQRAYCSYVVKPTTIATGANVVDVTVTFSLPFTISPNYADATWYFMTLRGHYVYYAETPKDIRTNQSSKENTDAYKWAFMGNPYTGIKVINKAVGEGKYMDNTSGTVQMTENAFGWTIESLNGTPTFGLKSGNQYINEQNHSNHNLIYWTQFTNDTGSQFTVEAVPTVVVNVTYDLYENGTKVDSKVVEQEPNSEVAVPSDLTAAYNALAWDITTEGAVGGTDCTINVTATPKAGVVTDLANLSREKVYRLVTSRGNLGTDGSHLATDGKSGITLTGTTFAFPTYGTDMYLYSVADNKFVANVSTGDLTEDISTLGALVIDGAKGYYFLGMGTNGVNVSTGYPTGIVINSWTTRDAGNQYVFIEAGNFDPTAAEAALDTYFDNVDMTAQVMAEFIPYVLAMPIDLTNPKPAATLGKPFGITTAAAYQLATTYQTQLFMNKFSLADYNAIKEIIEANIIYPETGYYRLKNKLTGTEESTSYGYMGMNANAELIGNVAEADAMADASTVFYVKKNEAGYYSFRSQGLYGKVAETSATVTADDSEHNFIVGHAGPGYGYIKTKSATDRSCYHAAATQGYMVVGWGADADASQWVFEPATTVELALGVSDGTNTFGTVCLPFAVEITDAEICKIEPDYASDVANYSSVGTQLPAGTGAFLVGTTATVEATIVDGGELGAIETGLEGHLLAAKEDGALVLNTAEGNVGFYTLKSGFDLGANKAFLTAPSSVRALVLSRADDVTAISQVETVSANGAIYDLSGRRVKNVQNGLYIVNGKKVLVK